MGAVTQTGPQGEPLGHGHATYFIDAKHSKVRVLWLVYKLLSRSKWIGMFDGRYDEPHSMIVNIHKKEGE